MEDLTLNIHQDRILILDFGSQYTQLIARRVREAGCYCEIYPFDLAADKINQFKPKGVILSGGPQTVTKHQTPRISQAVFDLNCPILGICYGMQALANQLGGEVSLADKKEYGHAKLEITSPNALLEGLEDINEGSLSVWMSHGDKVTQLPKGFSIIGKSANAQICAMANEDKQYYGLQFHPEVTHTPKGQEILTRFINQICGCTNSWNPDNIITSARQEIKTKVGDDLVILGLSGGVDSSVVAALMHQAIGKQLICVFVDNGLLRLNEAAQVMDTFATHMGLNVIKVDAQKKFYEALKGVTCPEQKRKIIGRVFIEVFDSEAKKLPNVKWLAQGTIYPDVIESAGGATGKANVIKSHHNVGGLPEKMHLKLIEPLKELFKDEVRKIGVTLGLAKEMVYRHPFPGPGLGVRILGEVKQEYADILRKADNIFIETLHKFDLYHKVSQAFVVFLPVKSVGVVGDARCYEYVVSLRAVETLDFMTARWAHLPYELLEEVSGRIINEVSGISRVTYDVSSKPPATIEWE